MKYLVSDGTMKELIDTMKAPDWVQLLFKVKSRLPDNQWQSMLNLTQLGSSKVS